MLMMNVLSNMTMMNTTDYDLDNIADAYGRNHMNSE